jgi:hypothetical protein
MVQAMNFFPVSVQGLVVHLEADLARRSIRLPCSRADQIHPSTIIIVRFEAEFPVKKPDILETSEFF